MTSITPLRRPWALARVTAATAAALALATGPALAAPPAITFGPTQFLQTGQSGQAALDANGTAAGDLDADGHQDIAMVAPWNGNKLVIFYGTGTGTFGAPQTLTVGGPNNNVILGDYNEDGRLDLVVTSLGSVVVLTNQGARTYQQTASYALWQNPFQATGFTADLDGDGDLDLALKAVNGIRALLGDGNGTFTSGPLTTIPLAFPGEIAMIDRADLDGDETVDVVAGLGGTQRVVAMTGNGDGSFSVTDDVFVPFVPTTVKAGDLDGNGTDDLVVLPEGSPPSASAAVVLNDGTGALGQPTYYNGGFGNPNGTLADLNGDTHLDVVSVNTFTGDLVILAGVGDGTLAPAGTFGTAASAQTPVAVDFDEDGRPDLAVPSSCPGSSGWNKVCLALLRNES